jgi:hypothetical protein
MVVNINKDQTTDRLKVMFSFNGDGRKYAFPYKIGYGVAKFIKFFKKRGSR